MGTLNSFYLFSMPKRKKNFTNAKRSTPHKIFLPPVVKTRELEKSQELLLLSPVLFTYKDAKNKTGCSSEFIAMSAMLSRNYLLLQKTEKLFLDVLEELTAK